MTLIVHKYGGTSVGTAERIQAGIIWHNDWFVDGVNLPGGGYKKSGYGRDGGIDSLYSYGQTKRVSKRLN